MRSLAASRDQNLAGSYKTGSITLEVLTELAVRLTARGGVLVQSSCSSRVGADAFFHAVTEAASSLGRPLDEIERTYHGIDHPVGFAQGSYLKTLFALVS